MLLSLVYSKGWTSFSEKTNSNLAYKVNHQCINYTMDNMKKGLAILKGI
jgi:hypothetical protein